MKNKVADMMCTTTNGDQSFAPEDLQWVLTQDVRADIMYAGVTQETRTTDLVTYRRDWFNKGGTPFITFRDYCEWINIFAYDDSYQMDRGDALEDIEIESGDTTINLKSTDGWLTLEAFAVWKRMEKYENNVEYIAMSNEYTPFQEKITAPIYKRQISTTVFPRIHDSGIQTVDSNGLLVSDKYTIQTNIEMPTDKSPYKEVLSHYQWGDGSENFVYKDAYKKHGVDLKHLRHVYCRFEYNECYNKFTISERYNATPYENATLLIDDPKFAKPCDSQCGGDEQADTCKDHTHALYNLDRWFKYYKKKTSDSSYFINLDEDSYPINNTNGYTYLQFYVPYNTFKSACQQIKSVYGDKDGYANYMKYWARNGNWTDICDLSAYPVMTNNNSSFRLVTNTYLSTNFWNSYDGTTNPATGVAYANGAKAVGF